MAVPLDPANRPRPLLVAVRRVAALRAVLGGLATAGAGVGLMSLTPAHLDAITALLAAAPGALAALTGLLAALGVVKGAEPNVTPTESPAIVGDDGGLVALVPDEGRHALPGA